MKRVMIVQARANSARLPGKVLSDLGGRPMLAQQLLRLRQCRQVDEIVVATTTDASDEPVALLARQADVRVFRGATEDVLLRFVGAAREARADVVVRVTADCPLIDPEVCDRVISELLGHSSECDYASNVMRRTFPRGLDTEAMFWDVLLRIDRLARSTPAREHVTIVPRSERPALFLCRDVVDATDNSDLRWTVDTPDDLRLLRLMFEELDLGERCVPYREILAYVRARPELAAINAGGYTWSPP
jgi:spore coat polysaccharide biosynthesis protein SpsF